MKKNPVIITIALMISNIVVKFLGLVRDIVLANTYGTSIYSDAYIVANNIPIVIFSVVAVAVSTSFIPIYSEIEVKEGNKKALRFANNFINILLVITLIITLIGEIFPGLLVKLFAFGFTSEAYELTIKFTQILLPSIIVIAIMSVSGSYLQLKKDFLPISYVSIPNNIITIIAILIAFYTDKPIIMAIGTLLGIVSQLAYYYPFIKKKGYKHSLYINFRDSYIRKALTMILPMFIGAAVNEVNVILDRSLVSGLEQGSIAALNYASKLIGFITGVFIVSIITIIYPKMSNLSAQEEYLKLRKYISDNLTIFTLIIIPITFISIVFSDDIVRIMFERGTFDSKSTSMTALALCSYSIGLIGIAYREVITKAYFSLKDTKTPMINGVIAVALNIILNIILIKKIGFFGSAIATSIVSIVTSILLLTTFNKKFGKIITKEDVIENLKIVFAASVSVFIGLYCYRIINLGKDNIFIEIIILGCIVLGIFLIYIILLIIVKQRNVKDVITVLKTKIKK